MFNAVRDKVCRVTNLMRDISCRTYGLSPSTTETSPSLGQVLQDFFESSSICEVGDFGQTGLKTPLDATLGTNFFKSWSLESALINPFLAYAADIIGVYVFLYMCCILEHTFFYIYTYVFIIQWGAFC